MLRTRRRRVTFLLFALLGPLLGLSLLGAWLHAWGSHDRARRCDAIVVLGARVNASGQASPILRARARRAFELWQAGLAPVIVCTGGVGTYPPAESAVAAELLRGWGVPPAAILTEAVSTSTRENASETAQLLPHGAQIILVSEPFHLWRARRDCAKVGLVAFTSPERSGWAALPAHSKVYYCLREALLVVRDVLRG